MTAITTQHLTEEDYKWLEEKIREEFDTPKQVYELDKDVELIARAERFGFYKLAEQMRGDIMLPAKLKVA